MPLQNILIPVAFGTLAYQHFALNNRSETIFRQKFSAANTIRDYAKHILFGLGTLLAGVMLGTVALAPVVAMWFPAALSASTISSLNLLGFATIPAAYFLRMIANAIHEGRHDDASWPELLGAFCTAI